MVLPDAFEDASLLQVYSKDHAGRKIKENISGKKNHLPLPPSDSVGSGGPLPFVEHTWIALAKCGLGHGRHGGSLEGWALLGPPFKAGEVVSVDLKQNSCHCHAKLLEDSLQTETAGNTDQQVSVQRLEDGRYSHDDSSYKLCSNSCKKDTTTSNSNSHATNNIRNNSSNSSNGNNSSDGNNSNNHSNNHSNNNSNNSNISSNNSN
eukprot:TRINITY_DN10357_c0_g4_i6.p1 TRINITY_DN10357_c0_g4~~TRINITY_DN10357_c0_g4_i6.p1  ORF type:complete len:214 (+),score=52.71 TRINITY_DN10357_c0_g4_i6:27-644(+)